MKIPSLIAIALVLAATSGSVQGQIENYSISPNVTIPDNDINGVASTISVGSSAVTQITGVQVTLNITGGFNGDYFAYLVHTSSGGSTVGFVNLMNRVGVTGSNPVGYGDAGFNVTFTLAGNDIHLYQNFSNPGGAALTGSWGPDGRSASPFGVTDASPRTSSLTSFNSFAGTGTWTLFIADVSGGGQGQFVSWGFSLQGAAAVPEPGTYFAGVLASIAAFGAWRRRRQS